MNLELFDQVLLKTTELKSKLSAKNWVEAIAVDRERLELLSKLSESEGLDRSSQQYQELLEKLSRDIRERQRDVENELARCRTEMGELGRHRKASSLYRDTALTR